MKEKTSVVVAFLVVVFMGSTALAAAKSIDYSPDAFAEAQAAGKFIIVDVYADWCPTCRAQRPILAELKTETELENAVFVTVDYDRDKDFLRTHRIPRQSTILVFHGERELTRSIAETNRERLRGVVLSAVGH